METTSAVQGKLWGARASDWAQLQEPLQEPLFEAVFAECRVGNGTKLLDVGCGAGRSVQMASERGAKVTGLDASEKLIDIARKRSPKSDLRIGEMQQLPFSDGVFDVVTGFNSFQYAASPVAALAEAKRVMNGGKLAIAVWGPQEQCQATAIIAAFAALLPPPPPGAPGPHALSGKDKLQSLLKDAGLRMLSVHDVACPWVYPDEATALRANLSAGPLVKAIEVAGEARVRDALSGALAQFRRSDGSYRLDNVFRFAVASS